MKTVDQQRAVFAWDKVQEAQDRLHNKFKEYASLMDKLPALIHTSGLGQAFAFLAAKAGLANGQIQNVSPSAHQLAYRHLEEWLKRPGSVDCRWRGPYAGEEGGVLDAIMSRDCMTYLRAKGDALSFLNYLRMFATALEKGSATTSWGEQG